MYGNLQYGNIYIPWIPINVFENRRNDLQSISLQIYVFNSASYGDRKVEWETQYFVENLG